MFNRFRHMALTLAVASLAMTPVAAMGLGSDDDEDEKKVEDSGPATEYQMGVAAVEAQDWSKAMMHMAAAIDEDANNADAFNYLGYARRKSGDFEGALKAYNVALAINPEHKGAHEYVGQAYLEMGNIQKAEEHLSTLNDICTFGCAEYTSLKKAVAKAKGTS